MARPGYFVIRARVEPRLWEAFNRWYQDAHLPLAARRLGASEALRLHDRDEPCVHVAVYRFDDIGFLDTPEGKAELQALIADFNAHWPEGVVRRRMYFDLVEKLGRGPDPGD